MKKPEANLSFIAAVAQLHCRAALNQVAFQQIDVDYSDSGSELAILIGHLPDTIYYSEFQIAPGESLDVYRDFIGAADHDNDLTERSREHGRIRLIHPNDRA